MKAAEQNTVEWEDGDLVWNPITFNARLFRVWLHEPGAGSVPWTPNHTWQWTPPAGSKPWIAIDLRDYCQPQSFMVRFWHVPKNGVVLRIFASYLFSLVLGILMLGWVALRTVRDQRAESVREFDLDGKVARTACS